jgi:hypothetical protein
MKNYILIISVLTTIVVFIVIYLSDYIKAMYFNNCVEDFQDVASIISNAGIRSAQENFENKEDVRSEYQKKIDAIKFENNKDIKSEYQKRVEALRADFYEKNSPQASAGSASATTAGSATKLEESLSAQSDFYQNGLLDKYSTITDPIGDEYLPYTVKNYKDDPVAITKNNMNEYTIINVYKNILDRQPSDKELNKNLQDFYENDIDESILKLRIYNSSEYKIITNMQSNDIKPELITNISKGQLKDKLKKFYKDQYNTILINTRLIDILIKCYIHLQFNDYLFKAMLMHDKYMAFENKLRDEVIMSDEKILELFNRTFILYELRLIANELKRQDIIKRKAFQIPIALYNNNKSELSSSNVNLGAGKHISDIVKNSDNIFNINIMVKDTEGKTSMPFAKNNNNIPNSSSVGRGSGTAYINTPNAATNSIANTATNSVSNSIANTATNSVSNSIANAATNSVSNSIANAATNSVSNSIANAVSNAATNSVSNSIANAVSNAAIAAESARVTSAAGGGGVSNAMNAVGGGGAVNSANTAAAIAAAAATTASTVGTGYVNGSSVNSGSVGGGYVNGSSVNSGSVGGGSVGGGSVGGYVNGGSVGGGYVGGYVNGGSVGGGSVNNNQINNTQEGNIQTNDSRISSRIYNPINYKFHYRGDMIKRPNVCSYGTKQIVQPIFLNSSTLFQGTDLKEAVENTQVGSIMPKFEYNEYEDTI